MVPVGIVVAIMLACAGLALLVHHGWIHSYDEPSSHAKTESSAWIGYFQIMDVSHVETWIVVCWANALCIALVFLVFFAWAQIPMTAFAVCVGFGGVGLMLLLDWSVAYVCFDGSPLRLHHIANHETWIVACWTCGTSVAWLEFVK